MEEIAISSREIQVRFHELKSQRGHWNQVLYLTVHGAGIDELNADLNCLLKRPPGFAPPCAEAHVSLLYERNGHLPPHAIQKVYGQHPDLFTQTFTVSALEIWDVGNGFAAVTDWKLVYSFTLPPNNHTSEDMRFYTRIIFVLVGIVSLLCGYWVRNATAACNNSRYIIS